MSSPRYRALVDDEMEREFELDGFRALDMVKDLNMDEENATHRRPMMKPPIIDHPLAGFFTNPSSVEIWGS